MGGLAAAGFVKVEVSATFDPFKGAAKEQSARRFGVRGVNVRAVRPGS